MKSLRTYLRPQAEEIIQKKTSPPASLEMTPSAHALKTPGVSGKSTPGYSGSRPASLYPTGDFRNSSVDFVSEVKSELMATHLHKEQTIRSWYQGGEGEGVVLKKSRDAFTADPPELKDPRRQNGLFDMVRRLNVKVSESGVYDAGQYLR